MDLSHRCDEERLFSDGTDPAGLKLVANELSTTRVVMATYVPAGEIVTRISDLVENPRK